MQCLDVLWVYHHDTPLLLNLNLIESKLVWIISYSNFRDTEEAKMLR